MLRNLSLVLVLTAGAAWAAEPPKEPVLIAKPEAIKALDPTHCSHCVIEANRRKKELRADDRVLCWRQVYHDGYINDGAIPLRFFLSTHRILNDGWGVFVYDPDAGYVRGYRNMTPDSPVPSARSDFQGWRNGVMVLKTKDGTLYSGLTGIAFEGPKKGHRLEPIPTLVSDWGFWHKRYPEAMAYTMFDKYQPVDLPTEVNEDSRKSRGPADKRLPPDTMVLGVWDGKHARAYPLDVLEKAGVLYDTVKDQPRVVFWYGPTRTAVAYRPGVFTHGQSGGYLGEGSFSVDPKGGDAPFVAKRTGGHWDITGRGTGGGPMLAWMDSIQVKWFAWAAEYPETDIYLPPARSGAAPDDKPVAPQGGDGTPGGRPKTETGKTRPKTGGTDNDPLIQLEIPNLAGEGKGETLLAALNQLPWASRTAVLPHHPGAVGQERLHPGATAVVALAERQWADVADLVRRIRGAGFTVAAMHLTHFGTVRIHTRFGPLRGETIEVTEGKKKRIVLAPTNPARQGIEAAFRKVAWLADVHYTEAGTKPDFGVAPDKPELPIAFHLRPNQAIEIGTLLEALDKAGCPPVSVRVARMAAGVPFGFPIPSDVKLVDRDGVQRMSGQLQKPGRPLVLVFFPLRGKFKNGKEEHTYQAEPGHFARLKEVALKYADRADFVGISGRKEDAFADVTALWRKADMPFPVLHDAAQELATVLSAALVHPPPHVFIADAEGHLRYAGDFADGWIEPEKIGRVYLVEALDRVLAKNYADNGAVFYNSLPCDCSAPACACPKCGCGGPCRCGYSTGEG